MWTYREIPPPERLSEAVECFWTGKWQSGPSAFHRVAPDGCADILVVSGNGRTDLRVVGPMTTFGDFSGSAAGSTLGMRFRPGMWTATFGVPADTLTDRLLPLEDLWGCGGKTLLDRLRNADSANAQIALLSDAVRLPRPTGFQRAIAWMSSQRGRVSLDDVSNRCGLGVRQFRRVCLRETGLSPKLLARILRFRHARERVRTEAGAHAGLAADCGFADQAHLISEFKRFYGRTPLGTARVL